MQTKNQNKQYDIIINGAGMVGLALALALAKSGMKVAVIEKDKPLLKWKKKDYDARVSSIHMGSYHFFHYINVWSCFNKVAYAPLRKMHVWDDLGGGEIDFNSADIGASQLGFVVENREIQRVLWQQAEKNNQIDLLCPAQINTFIVQDEKVKIILENKKTITASVLIGADGGRSWLREQMNVPTRERSYDQQALIAMVEAEKPHQYSAYQSFLNTGPLGVLPSADPHQASFVWSCDIPRANELMDLSEKEFNMELTNALQSRLGYLKLLNSVKSIPLTMRHAEQYVMPRLALVGDAAHTIHPLAGQGVNLGLMDAACLAQCFIDAKEKQQDFGSLRVLRRYERWRKADNTTMILAMRSFKELFGSNSPFVIQARSMGFNSVNKLDVIKQCFMRFAMGEQSDFPELCFVPANGAARVSKRDVHGK